MEQRILEVTQVNQFIKAALDAQPMLQGLSVRGELSNYKVYPSGHHYFTLKDAESSLRCVMFKSSAMRLRFRPESGMQVIVSGRISVFPRDGAYQLYCDAMMPEGMGDLHVAFEQLKRKLSEEGLFDPRYKKPLPKFPHRIAIITSSAGAAIHDMLRILKARYPLSKVLLLPVRVQGVEAPPEIVGAIRYANHHQLADLIITGRGGGSIEDLWAFNDERVARAIFESEIPVISAVGHEPDVTISDYVADARASTPSNAAEIAVPDQVEERDMLLSSQIRLSQAMQRLLDEQRSHMADIAGRKVMTTPTAFIDNKRIDLDRVRERLISVSERYVSQHRKSHVHYAAKLDALSPLKVLSRGYSVVRDEYGKAVRHVSQVEIGDSIRVTISGGNLDCRVENKVINNGEETNI